MYLMKVKNAGLMVNPSHYQCLSSEICSNTFNDNNNNNEDAYRFFTWLHSF